MSFFSEFFYINKSDRRVIIVLLLIIVMAGGVVWWLGSGKVPTSSSEDSLTYTKKYRKHHRHRYVGYQPTDVRRAERFPFDPNTADSNQLLRLGLQPWQVRNIYKYRAAGGIYRKPLDFAKLYGLTVKQYRELEPYIRISSDYLPASTLVKEERQERDTLKYPIKLKETETLLLNEADTNALRKVPGIGSGFARAIVNYRQRLGGFVKTEQLMEIDGFPEEALSYLKVENPHPRKLNINRLSLNELKRHPYINFFQAKAITDYRRLRGPIHSLQDLRLSKDFPPEAIQRLEPYVEYE